MAHPFRKPKFAGKSWEKKPTSTPAPEPPPLGPLLNTIVKKDLIVESKEHVSAARITDCQYVASFNWRHSRGPCVFIPGKSVSKQHLHANRRSRGTNSRLMDAQENHLGGPLSTSPENSLWTRVSVLSTGWHCPTHPFEATALSVLHTQPEPSKTPLDIVCSSSSLGYLVSLCINENDFREFRALVEVVGGVVHIFRRENAPDEMIQGVKGYGHTFPATYTTWDAGTEGSTSHQRVIKYNLGGLNILLRGEVDGYLPDAAKPAQPQRKETSLDELADKLASSSLSQRAVDTSASSVTIKAAGSPVPQSSLFDLKTRSIHRKDDDILSQQIPRLWRSQTPNFILAFHDRGTFNDISVKNVQDRIDEWERENAEGIALLVALLHRIVDVVTNSPEGKVEIRAVVGLEIEVRGHLPDAGEAFSASVREKWEDWLRKACGTNQGGSDGDGKEGDTECSSDEDSFFSDHSDDAEAKDFTACDADSCGYCGQCSY